MGGIIAGIAALIEPGGFLLIGLLGLIAVRDPVLLRRYARTAIISTAIAVIVNGVIFVRSPVIFPPNVLLTLIPLALLAALNWRQVSNLREHTFSAVLIACGALDSLVRVVIFHQSPTLWVIPGLVLLAANFDEVPLQALALISNVALLILSLGVLAPIPQPTLALRRPIETMFLSNAAVMIPYGDDLTLVGISTDQNAAAGRQVRVLLDWAVRVAPTSPVTIQLDLLTADQKSILSIHEDHVLTQGRATTDFTLIMPDLPDLPPGALTIYVSVTYQSARLGQHPAARVIVPLGGQIGLPELAHAANSSQFLNPLYNSSADHVGITLNWRSTGNLDRDYKFFLHVQDSADHIVAQYDAEPRSGTYPTSLWQPGDVIRDPVSLDLSKLAPGDYALWFGMYATDQHLPLWNCANQKVDQLRLATLHIAPDRSVSVTQPAPVC